MEYKATEIIKNAIEELACVSDPEIEKVSFVNRNYKRNQFVVEENGDEYKVTVTKVRKEF